MANCFWWGELESELRERNMISYKFTNDTTDGETCMKLIEKERCKTLYQHPENDCTTECKARGMNIFELVFKPV